jgi:hypothetical protein
LPQLPRPSLQQSDLVPKVDYRFQILTLSADFESGKKSPPGFPIDGAIASRASERSTQAFAFVAWARADARPPTLMKLAGRSGCRKRAIVRPERIVYPIREANEK